VYQTSFWGGFVSVIGAYYLLPLFLAFLIAYALLPIDPIQGPRQKVPLGVRGVCPPSRGRFRWLSHL